MKPTTQARAEGALSPTTRARIDRAIAIIEAGPIKGAKLTTRQALELLVIETDRDTRHACAEAVLASDPRDSASDHPAMREALTRAHQACMNTSTI